MLVGLVSYSVFDRWVDGRVRSFVLCLVCCGGDG